MRNACIAALLSLGAACACAQVEPRAPAPAPASPLAPFGWFADLAGSCWTGPRGDGKTTDTQCFLAQYEHLIRGSFKVEEAGSPRPIFEGDAVFAVDPDDKERKRIVYTQWGTGGVYATGEIVFEGEKLVFHSRLPDGTAAPHRHVWRRTGPDSFEVRRERNEDSRWVEVFTAGYKRIPGR